MSDIQPTLATEVKKYRETLETLRDEIKVRIHLGNMEVKDLWKNIEPQIVDAEKAATGAASEATRALLTETVKKLLSLRSRLPH